MNITQAIFRITKNSKTTDLQKIRELTALYFSNNTVGTGPCKEASRIMLAIETVATESLLKQQGVQL